MRKDVKVKTLAEWTEERDSIVKWAEEPLNLIEAHLRQPFLKDDEPPLQMDLLNALRKHYIRYAPSLGSKKVTIKLQKCKEFFLKDCDNKIIQPTFRYGEYDHEATCIVDFANRVFGGGFLSHGFAQEERLILSYLDIAWMVAKKYARGNMFAIGEDEAIIIEGAAAWSEIEFYGAVPDNWLKQIKCHAKPKDHRTIIAIDCLPVTFKKYDRATLMWILRKAYVGFASVKEDEISTGNWGTGIYLNNKNVTFCLQVLAATLAHKQLAFYGLGNLKTKELVQQWHDQGKSVEKAFEELLHLCDTDEDFITTAPHMAINKNVTIDPVRLPLNSDFTRRIVRPRDTRGHHAGGGILRNLWPRQN